VVSEPAGPWPAGALVPAIRMAVGQAGPGWRPRSGSSSQRRRSTCCWAIRAPARPNPGRAGGGRRRRARSQWEADRGLETRPGTVPSDQLSASMTWASYAPAAVLAARRPQLLPATARSTLPSVARALWVDVTSRGLNEGGSTRSRSSWSMIQLLTPQKSLTRKVSRAGGSLVRGSSSGMSKGPDPHDVISIASTSATAHMGVGAAAKTLSSTKSPKDLTAAQAPSSRVLIQGANCLRPCRALRPCSRARAAIRTARHGRPQGG